MISKTEFEIIEGGFHDGLGTYAELILGNEIIRCSSLSQMPFEISGSTQKMRKAIDNLPAGHISRQIFELEIRNIEHAAKQGAEELIKNLLHTTLVQVRHVATKYQDANAAD